METKPKIIRKHKKKPKVPLCIKVDEAMLNHWKTQADELNLSLTRWIEMNCSEDSIKLILKDILTILEFNTRGYARVVGKVKYKSR